MAKIEGSRVLIAGASSGIGRATVFELAKRGAILALSARKLKTLRTIPEVLAPLSTHY